MNFIGQIIVYSLKIKISCYDQYVTLLFLFFTFIFFIKIVIFNSKVSIYVCEKYLVGVSVDELAGLLPWQQDMQDDAKCKCIYMYK
jgi:hypothetical protein